jgi:hypothetical protein
MANRQFTNWRRLEAPYGHASFAVVDGVLTLNSSLGKKQAQLNGETVEGLAQALLHELLMERE